ncbi:MAG: protein translocase subunit SecD, partial [Calditrichota bacterium]
MSLDEILGQTIDTTNIADSTVTVDKQILNERPFSALLRNVGGNIGVPVRNRNAVQRILQLPAVQEVIPPDAEFLWSADTQSLSGQTGGAQQFYTLYLVNRDAGLQGGVVTDARATLGGTGSTAAGQPIVTVDMNSAGTRTWSRLTGANIGRRVAIVLDNRVHMAPVIRGKIPGGRTQIEGMADMEEAKDIAIVLRAGALPAPVDIIEERTIGPSLGVDSIHKGTRATALGLMLVILVMAFYYKGSGLIADL